MKTLPLISVVIPTRNRQPYCMAAIEDILSYDDPQLELCIQDNSDDDQLKQYVEARKYDARLVYRYVPERLNSLINMDQAIGMASGKYVIMLGDDDTILPDIFSTVQWMETNGVDSVCSNTRVQYFWPGAHAEDENGLMRIVSYDAKYCDRSMSENLHRLFRQGITRFKIYLLPQVYHGIILRERLQEIKQRTGHFFGGLSPDIYSTIALCKVVENHRVINTPVSIAGACKSSSTSQNTYKAHCGRLEDTPHLILRGPYEWDNYVPAYYSVETLWAESAIKAVREMGMEELLKEFNYSFLAAYALLNNRTIFKLAWQKTFSKQNYFVKNDPWLKWKFAIAVLQVLCDFAARKWKRCFKTKSENIVAFHGAESISVAVKQYQDWKDTVTKQ